MDFSPLLRRWRSSYRFRVTLRGLMGVVLLLALPLGWYVRCVRVQQEAVEAVKLAGGSVTYDWEWGHSNPDIESTFGRPRMPNWLARLFGPDYVASVVHVSLVPRPGFPKDTTDAVLAQVRNLHRLEFVSLNSSGVTDAGLAQLAGMPKLRQVELFNAQVGDAGLVHLQKLPALRFVFLAGSRVSDEGILALEKAVPGISILLEEDTIDPKVQAQVVADPQFARTLPVRRAAKELIHRARMMAARGDDAGIAATVDVFCSLDADDKLSLVRLAEASNELLGILQPGLSPRLPAAQRQALRLRCADRGVAVLTRAVEKGYDDVRRLDGDPQTWPPTLGLMGTLKAQASGR